MPTLNFSPPLVSVALASDEESSELSSTVELSDDSLELLPASLELPESLPQAAKQPTTSIRTSSMEITFFMFVFLLGT